MKSIMQEVRVLAALTRPRWSEISAAIKATGVPTMDGTAVIDSPRAAIKSLNSQLAELRQEKPKLAKEMEDCQRKYIEAGMPGDDSPEFKATEAAVKAHGEVVDTIAELAKSKNLILESTGQAGTEGIEGENRPVHDRAANDATDPRGWNTTQLFAGDAGGQLRAQLEEMSGSSARVGAFRLGQVCGRDEFRDMLAADVAPTSDQRRGNWLGVIPQLRRPLRVLDLLPIGTMDNNTLPYTREEGSFTTAKGVKEGAAKPESGVTFTDAEAVARTIAHWMKVRKQALSDVSALRSIMDSRLRYGVERILEKEAINGKGEDPEIEGFQKVSGISVTKFAEDITQGADLLLKAITTILLNEGQATGIIIHPTDWQEIILSKSIFNSGGLDSEKHVIKAGSGQYFSGGPFSSTPQVVWGVPLVPSPAVTQHVPIAGDFEMALQLFIREGVNVLMSDSDGEDFIKNRITMLAEMRAAQAIFRPSILSKVYLTKEAEEAAL